MGKNKIKNKPKILFILQIPHPFHGASILGAIIKNSLLINEEFECEFLRNFTTPLKNNSNNIFLKLINLFTLYKSLILKLLTEKYDLVYIEPTLARITIWKDIFITFIVKRKHKKKVIYHFFNNGIKENKYVPEYLKNIYFENAKVILFDYKLFCNIEKYVSFKDVFILPNCSSIPLKNEFKRNYECEKPIILFYSNIIESYDLWEIIFACKILLDRGKKFECIIVGKNYNLNLKKNEKYLVNNNLKNVIKLLKQKNNIEKEGIFRISDIYVLPTYYHDEGFPLFLLEAMQFKLPIITTDVGAISEIINNEVNGLVINKKSSVEIADNLERLIDNKQLRKSLGEKAFEKFTSNFSQEIFINNYIKILKENIE